ncbi:MAG: hypothetical protein V4494_00925 [Chlamydiota bacterium]
MTSSPINSERTIVYSNQFLGPFTDVCKEMERLACFVSYDKSRPLEEEEGSTDNLDAELKAIAKILINCKLSSNEKREPDQLKNQIIQNLGKIGLAFPLIKQLKSAKTVDEIRRFAKIFFHYKCAALYPSRVQKPNQGLNGPTLLIEYPKLSKNNLSETILEASVLKCTDPIELACHAVYYALANVFQENGATSIGFSVPKVGGLDFLNSTYHSPASTDYEPDIEQDIRNKQFGMPKDAAQKLKAELTTLINKLPKSFVASEEEKDSGRPPHSFVLLSERIVGSHLLDAVITGKLNFFRTLKEEEPIVVEPVQTFQQNMLLRQFALLTAFDLFMGNFDRLASLEKNDLDDDNSPYFLQTKEANLANLMIDFNHTAPIVYAIDNRTQPEFIENPDLQNAYNRSLGDLLTSSKGRRQIGENIQNCITNFMERLSDNGDIEITNEIEDNRQDFLNLIHSKNALDQFEKGIEQGVAFIRGVLFNNWNSEKGVPLRNYLSNAAPEVLDFVDTQFKFFRDMKERPVHNTKLPLMPAPTVHLTKWKNPLLYNRLTTKISAFKKTPSLSEPGSVQSNPSTRELS